ncbi:hypothetical protein [Methylobacterium sp. E-045]|uniref:hypothetical protein n=1 Tax=Methylobacterium sp. E-045 TaxID=2836575 RepID=UPI001FB94DE4|nr:hypothetical protein [Methylobacterium sp. E-045]MCJ2128453.1 hypothetical protein [Methylobacterium sp. E-045]
MRELRKHEIERVSGGSSVSLTLTADNFYQSLSVFKNGLLVEYDWSNLWVWTQSLTTPAGTTTNIDVSFTSYAWKAS